MVAKIVRFQLLRINAAALLIYLILLQFILTPGVQAPPVLFWSFVAINTVVLMLLEIRPHWGGWGCTLWGMMGSIGVLRTHQPTTENWAMIILSLSLFTTGVLFLAGASPWTDGFEQE